MHARVILSLGATLLGPPRTWRGTMVNAAAPAAAPINLRRLESDFMGTDLGENDIWMRRGEQASYLIAAGQLITSEISGLSVSFFWTGSLTRKRLPSAVTANRLPSMPVPNPKRG